MISLPTILPNIFIVVFSFESPFWDHYYMSQATNPYGKYGTGVWSVGRLHTVIQKRLEIWKFFTPKLTTRNPKSKVGPTYTPHGFTRVGLCWTWELLDEGAKGPQRVLCDYTEPTRFPRVLGIMLKNPECIHLAVWGAYIRWLGNKLPK